MNMLIMMMVCRLSRRQNNIIYYTEHEHMCEMFRKIPYLFIFVLSRVQNALLFYVSFGSLAVVRTNIFKIQRVGVEE